MFGPPDKPEEIEMQQFTVTLTLQIPEGEPERSHHYVLRQVEKMIENNSDWIAYGESIDGAAGPSTVVDGVETWGDVRSINGFEV
jgi:hypothetical protein